MRTTGFRPLQTGESIEASFTSVSVYEARGVTLQPGTIKLTDGAVDGVNYRIGVGAGLNDTCMALKNDVYVDDEDKWKKERKCSGPFVLIELGPTHVYAITAGHVKTENDGSATTFESFPNLTSDLAALEAAALPQIVTSLTCLLGEPNRQVELRKIDRVSTGQTKTGQALRDIRFQFSGTAYVSQGLPDSQLATNLRAVPTLAAKLNAKAARFFALGLGEDDELKQFLYFFLALEVETHAVFARIDHGTAVETLVGHTVPLQLATVALLQRQANQLRTLFDRFVWCATCVWPDIDDDDVELFRKLKAARDGIAHGSFSEPPQGYGRLAQTLARKVLR